MISLSALFIILISHFLCDFILQSDWMAINKSKSAAALMTHCLVYSAAMFFLTASVLFNSIVVTLIWVSVNFGLHIITDFVTSRINACLWQKEERHWFFVCVGFDQLLHYTALILTYYFFKQ
jgi:membrane-bound metal-dependent hydrolase YbcI (DUF457 family)